MRAIGETRVKASAPGIFSTKHGGDFRKPLVAVRGKQIGAYALDTMLDSWRVFARSLFGSLVQAYLSFPDFSAGARWDR